MKIMCASREEILKQKAEYEKQYNARKEQFEAEDRAFVEARKEFLTQVVEEIKAGLPTDLELFVDAELGFKGKLDRVRIEHRPNDRDDHQALAWDWRVDIPYGGEAIRKSTNSWSGLSATTSDQLDQLEKSVATLRYLQGIDWEAMFERIGPVYTDMVKTSNPQYEAKPDFNKMLKEVELEDFVGKTVLLHGTINNKNGAGWYYIAKENPATYEVYAVREYFVSSHLAAGDSISVIIEDITSWTEKRRMKKADLLAALDYPFVIRE